MATTKDKISDAITSPRRAIVDGDLYEAQRLEEQIKAAEYVDKKNAQAKSKLGILRYKIKPGSSL